MVCNTENLYIEGDNLDVLKVLYETYLHKIDIIYLDPPYNTGNNLIFQTERKSSYMLLHGEIVRTEVCHIG